MTESGTESGTGSGTSWSEAEDLATDLPGEAQIQSGTVSLGTYERARPEPDQALTLDGTNDYLRANGVSDVLAGTSAFTVEAWVYPTEPSGQQGVTAFNTGAGDNLNLLFYRDSQFEYYDDDIGRTASRNVFPAGQWYHVALTIDASNRGTLYVNGREEATFTTAVRPESGGLFSVGQEWDTGPVASDFFEGRIDEVRIWSQARTQAQLQQGMTTSLGEANTLGDAFDLSHLVAYYRLEGNAIDETGAHTGAIEGEATYAADVAQSTAADRLVVRVDAGGSGGTGNGTSWTNAHADLQDGLSGTGPENEIWIAGGTYTPSFELDTDSGTNDPRTATFYIPGDKDGIGLYGGFAGSETALSQRDPAANETILSGDIDGDGTPSGNSYHVLVFDGGDRIGPDVVANVTTATVLDGVTVTGGNAENGPPHYLGGGLLCDGRGDNNACTPQITGSVFTDNTARFGGAIFNDGLTNGTSSPQITSSLFTNNSALLGGAIYNLGSEGASSPRITNSTFTGNEASSDGGAIYNYSVDRGGTSSPVLTNVLLWGNTASDSGPEIYNRGDGSAPTLAHTLIEGGLAGISENNDSATTDGGGNLDADPLFVNGSDPDGADNVFGTADDGLRLLLGSPGLDAGDNSALPADTADLDGDGDTSEPLPLDAAGTARVQDNGSGAPTVDMGAYEGARRARPVIYVDAVNTSGLQNGRSWGTAYATLQDALAEATGANQIWIAAGTYFPDEGAGLTNNDRTASFTITGAQDGLQIYGGFAGREGSLSQRDIAANTTVLSGDIDGSGTLRGNTYHILVFDGGDSIGPDVQANVTTATLLDGVTITGGNANGGTLNDRGGGLFCDGRGTGNACNPSLVGLAFDRNDGGLLGGAMYNNGNRGTSSPQITNATFTGNTARSGGAIYNNGYEGTSSPVITGSTFTDNVADSGGGAMYNSGGSGFRAPPGTSHPVITNTILWGNTATSSGDEIYNNSATPTLAHTLIEGGLAGISEDGGSSTTDGGNNLDADPLFVDAGQPAGTDARFGTADDGLRIAGNSPAVDAGDNSAVPGGVTTDLIGDPRTQDGNEDGTDEVNLGAYETPGLPIAPSVTITGTNGTENDAGWRVLSVPYTGAVAGDVRMASSAGTNAPRFDRDVMAVWDDSDPDESTGGTGAYTTADASTPLGLGEGLLLYLEDDPRDPVAPGGLTVSLDKSTAATRHGTAPVVRNDLTQSARWHLVGNPYPTDYELSALTTGSSPTGGSPLAGNGFKADAQVYDATRGTWAIINTETETLSAWQGAFIERSNPGSGPTTVTFDPGGRTDASAPFIGSEMQGPTAASEGVQRGTLWLEGVVTDASGDPVATDQAIGVRFHESATNGWDAWDTSKLAPLEAPSVALSAQGPGESGSDVAKAVESRPWPQNPNDPDADLTAVPVAVQGNQLPEDGTLTLQVREWDLPDTWAAELIDTQGTSNESDDQTVPLEPGMDYPVDVSSLSTTPETERFVVQIAPNTGALPVELARFEAQRSGDDAITVQWQTLSETNNAGFEVQRHANSARGAVGNPTWDAIATLDGAGTTDTPQSYRFTDTDLPYTADSLRYRLRQIDTDGTESFSETVTIARQVTQAELLPTYPNPARGQATIRFAVPNRQTVRIALYDMLGRRVQMVTNGPADGRTEQVLDVSRLSSGTYFLRMQTGSHAETQQVTVVR